jgi:hypothetical protein
MKGANENLRRENEELRDQLESTGSAAVSSRVWRPAAAHGLSLSLSQDTLRSEARGAADAQAKLRTATQRIRELTQSAVQSQWKVWSVVFPTNSHDQSKRVLRAVQENHALLRLRRFESLFPRGFFTNLTQSVTLDDGTSLAYAEDMVIDAEATLAAVRCCHRPHPRARP